MQNIYKVIGLIVLLIFAAGCSTLSKIEKEKIHTVGVLNTFLVKPTWTVIGVTMFTNDLSSVPDRGYKELLTRTTIKYLEHKGYKVKEISNKNTKLDDNIDLILEIDPREVYPYPYTNGYGFVQRNALGTLEEPFAYVSLNITPILKKDYGMKQNYGFTFKSSTINSKRFEPITLKILPEKWSKLPDADQQRFEKILKINIEKTLEEQLPRLGL